MARLKGNAQCHTFSSEGTKRYENITWNDEVRNRCVQHRLIGKRGICLLDSSIECKSGDRSDTHCPINRDKTHV